MMVHIARKIGSYGLVCINLATAAHASQCYERPMLMAFLDAEHGLKLHSWGLDDQGNMLELLLSPDGHFALVTMRPNKCASVELPHQMHGRLWTPPSPNKAVPEDLRMNNGEAL
jgi:hypothetical protein